MASQSLDVEQLFDDLVMKQTREISKNENLINRMQSELELDQAKEKLALTELQGKILQMENYCSVATQQENARLKSIMKKQLLEIDKAEILATSNDELSKKWSFIVGSFANFDSSRDKNVEVDKGIIGNKTCEDLQILKRKIGEAEEGHKDLKSCLAEHQQLLNELESSKSSNNIVTTKKVRFLIDDESNVHQDAPKEPIPKSSEGVTAKLTQSSTTETTVNNVTQNDYLHVSNKSPRFVTKTKLDLYSGSVTIQSQLNDSEETNASSGKKPTPAFKLKIASRLRKVVN